MRSNLVNILEAHGGRGTIASAGGLLAHLKDGGESLSLCLGQSGADQGSPVTAPIPQLTFP
jgi:hypothetical protein